MFDFVTLNQKHLGDLVQAEIQGVISKGPYKFEAKIKGGLLDGYRAYVAYKGLPENLKEAHILVRIAKDFVGGETLFQDDALSTNFVSTLKGNFPDYLPFDKIIFYGVWSEKMMKLSYKIPNISKLVEFYFIGRIQHVLHYGLEREIFSKKGQYRIINEDIIPFSLFKNQQREVMYHTFEDEKPVSVLDFFENPDVRRDVQTRIRNPRSALTRYLTRHFRLIEKGKITPESPMVVSVDEGIKGLHLQEMAEYHNFILVKIEPQIVLKDNRNSHNPADILTEDYSFIC